MKKTNSKEYTLVSIGVFFREKDKDDGYEFQFVQEGGEIDKLNMVEDIYPAPIAMPDLDGIAAIISESAIAAVHGSKEAGYTQRQMLDIIYEKLLGELDTCQKTSILTIRILLKITMCICILEAFGRLETNEWNGVIFATLGKQFPAVDLTWK